MKRGWIALILLGIVLFTGTAEYIYVSGSADMYIAMLEEADGHMEKNEAAKALSVAERLDYRFTGQSGALNAFMFHNEISDIAGDIAMLRRYAQAGDVSEFLATSAHAKRQIIILKNAQRIKWENIF